MYAKVSHSWIAALAAGNVVVSQKSALSLEPLIKKLAFRIFYCKNLFPFFILLKISDYLFVYTYYITFFTKAINTFTGTTFVYFTCSRIAERFAGTLRVRFASRRDFRRG